MSSCKFAALVTYYYDCNRRVLIFGFPAVSDLNIENTNIKAASGVSLDEHQKTLVGSVLDVSYHFGFSMVMYLTFFQLFAGRPSLKKLQLWADDGTFEDPITKAVGRKQFEPQWYGLQSAFSEIERLHHEVTSAGNPIVS